MCAWQYLLVFHSGFWRIEHFQLPQLRSPTKALVAVIIPARNEADVIGRAVSSLLRQEYEGDLRLFLVDDNSNDGTANAARAAVGMLAMADKLTTLQGSELRPGWSGKVWAMQQGWQVAREMNPDYVLFTDADVEHSPGTLARLIAKSQSGKHDLVSILVKLQCETLAEKLLIPAFVYFFFLLYPPTKVADPRSKIGGAAGGCMLVVAEYLEKIGGLESIRNEIIDDCALAARIKEQGGRLWMGATRETRSIRGYRTFSNIRDMIARTAFNQLRHSAWLLAACIFGMFFVFAAPLALVWSNNVQAAWIALAACLMMFGTYVPILRFYRINILSAITLPFAAIFYLYATILSALRYWRGQGGEWKGRMQDQIRQ